MSTLRIDTIRTRSGTFPITASSLGKGKCNVWVKFDNNGNISDDLNVNTVGDNGTGDYTINFSNNLSTTNYVFAGTFGNSYGSGTSVPFIMPRSSGTTWQTVSSLRIFTKDAPSSGPVNFLGEAMVMIYGG